MIVLSDSSRRCRRDGREIAQAVDHEAGQLLHLRMHEPVERAFSLQLFDNLIILGYT
jgi:hypothetical protein